MGTPTRWSPTGSNWYDLRNRARTTFKREREMLYLEKVFLSKALEVLSRSVMLVVED